MRLLVPVQLTCGSVWQVKHTLKFWANGFSVDDGPLRDGNSEADREFIAAVSKGYATAGR